MKRHIFHTKNKYFEISIQNNIFIFHKLIASLADCAMRHKLNAIFLLFYDFLHTIFINVLPNFAMIILPL